jgi:imidazolonepropionase
MLELVLVNAGQLVTCAGKGDTPENKLGIIEDGALVVEDGKVAWTGTTREFRSKTFGKLGHTVDAQGALVTPGLVDPHTHLVFAGSREDEFERKLRGESYTEILKQGGGILRTVRDTRRASTAMIVKESKERLDQLLRNGVTTAEVKTGYGLSLEQELKLLDAIRLLERSSKVELVPTFLGLHATPPEFRTSKDFVAYASRVMLPAVAASGSPPKFSDCFCEQGVFTQDECLTYINASRELGLACKIHADEFSDSGGASLAGDTGCVSADHLGNSSRLGIESLAKNEVAAVLLPGTSLYSSIPYADASEIIKAGCTIALGTDLSPNSWVESPQYVMSLACNGMKVSPAEALSAFTRGAAAAIARDDIGSLVVGSQADFLIHSYPDYRFIPYRTGGNYIRSVFKRGIEIHSSMD